MHRATRSIRYIPCVIAALIVCPPSALAEQKQLTLGFDGLPEWSLDVGEYGVSFTGAAVLTCGLSLNCGPFPPYSGKSVIFDNFGSGGLIEAVFDTARTGSVSEVSARVTGNTNITMTAFDISGNVLSVTTTGGPNFVGSNSGIPANKLLTVSSSGAPIQRVTFRDSGNTFTVDDFTFGGNARKVAIDAGHGRIGGNFQRAPTSNLGIVEDELTLSIANALNSAFLSAEGVTTVMTRTGQDAPFAPSNCSIPCGIDLLKRRQLAEKQEADVLVSIHTNAHNNAQVNGTETFYSQAAPSDSAKAASLATKVNSQLVRLGLRDRGVKVDDWTVIYSTIEAVLTEVAFHSNTELAAGQAITDEVALSMSSFRNNAANAIRRGIIEYFEQIEGQP